MAPNNKPNINIQTPRYPCSTIIKFQHLNIFANWIEKKEILDYNKVGNISYKFELLYRASKDGNTITAFHNKCNNKGATIVIAKVAHSEQIFGGYNPLEWDSSNSWKSTNDSFIFSFTNRTNLQSAKVGYSNGNNNECSIYCGSDYGPAFGGGHDLYYNYNGTWYNNSNTNYTYSSYPNIYIPQNFVAEDYEVFQVIKNS